MKILHVIPSLERTEGGPSHILPLMEAALRERGHEVVTATTIAPGEETSAGTSSNHHLFPRQSEFYKVSFPLANWVKREIHEFDVVHIHALFSHSSVSAAKIAARTGTPYIIRPLGVLNRYGIRNRRRWLKQVSLRAREAPLIRNAAAIHFTSEAERGEAEMLGIEMNSRVIPLGIEFPEPPRIPVTRTSPTVLFLSRLDPKKNLEALIEAWSLLPAALRNGWTLKIAGNGDAIYVDKLKKLCLERNLAGQIQWCGFVEGTEKERLLGEASLFLLPSFSENFGIAAVEAMGQGIPSILTPGVAVGSEAAQEGGCLLSDTDPRALCDTISRLMSSPELRQTIGRRGHDFVRFRYGIASMTDALEALYRESIDASSNP